MLLRQLPCYDLQRLRNCSRRSGWLRQRSRDLTPSSVRIRLQMQWSPSPWFSDRTIDRPYQPDVGSVDRTLKSRKSRH